MRQFDNIREVLFADQIVEDRSGNQRQPLFIQRCAEFIGPGRQIAPRAQFNAFITGGRRFFQYLGPRRQIRVFGIIDAPAARRVGNMYGHDGFLFR